MSYQVAKSRSTTENSRHSLSTYFMLNTVLCTWQSQMTVPGGSAGKESACSVGDLGSIPGLGRCPGKGKGYPLQYSGLENSMDCNSPRGSKELDTTERLSLSFSTLGGRSQEYITSPKSHK